MTIMIVLLTQTSPVLVTGLGTEKINTYQLRDWLTPTQTLDLKEKLVEEWETERDRDREGEQELTPHAWMAVSFHLVIAHRLTMGQLHSFKISNKYFPLRLGRLLQWRKIPRETKWFFSSDICVKCLYKSPVLKGQEEKDRMIFTLPLFSP